MEFREYQDAAIESVFDYFIAGKKGNPIVAMPTGTGKSVVIGGTIQRALYRYPGTRVIALTHVKELIRQNAEKLEMIWPGAPLGIYSAGLNKRESAAPVIFGGVGTVHDNEEAFGYRDLCFIDECHLISPKDGTMYQDVIRRLKTVNPALKVIGYTATPFRMGQGDLTDEGLFTDYAFDITGVESFNRLIAEGWLCPLYPLRTNAHIETKDLKRGYDGDYEKEALENATLQMMWEGMQELVNLGWSRRSWMIFAPNVKSAEEGAKMLNALGVKATCVHGGNKEFKLTTKECNARLEAFKRGEFRAIVNANKLTTGFDHPPIDLIGMFRASTSPGLWVQMLGRGTRPFEGVFNGEYYRKTDCLVADFARNTERLGPINNPNRPRKPGDSPGEAPVKICPECGIYNAASARVCIACGHEFPHSTKLFESSGDAPLIESEIPITEWFTCDFIVYRKHEKAGRPDSVCVSYHSGLRKPFRRWLFPGTGGFQKKQFFDWWRKAAYTAATHEPPQSVEEFLARQVELKPARRIRVWMNPQKSKFPEVLNDEY
jgi:DNA repair protein RadD